MQIIFHPPSTSRSSTRVFSANTRATKDVGLVASLDYLFFSSFSLSLPRSSCINWMAIRNEIEGKKKKRTYFVQIFYLVYSDVDRESINSVRISLEVSIGSNGKNVAKGIERSFADKRPGLKKERRERERERERKSGEAN